jgi:hypothetical protein
MARWPAQLDRDVVAGLQVLDGDEIEVDERDLAVIARQRF